MSNLAMTEIEKLGQAMAALEAQRAALGDAMVDAMLAPAREKLAALMAQQPPTNQRKHVTVLFADVSGFTAMSESLDAEDVHDTINAMWEKLDGVITAHGGRIDKHIGDAVMALWGAQLAHEDDAERAIKAALAMQSELCAFVRARQRPLMMRIGLNTGTVLVGTVGSIHELTAMGDTVNVASRLEHAAPVGGILISHDTYRHVRGVFDVTPQPPLTVKGKSEPLQTYLVRHIKPRTFRLSARGVEGVETNLVGRAAEMEQLRAAYNEVAQQGVTRSVLVAAEAGLGKSRLMQELMQWAEIDERDFFIFRGQTSPSASGTPYALLRDTLSFRFEIQESDPLDAVRLKLETGMAALCPNDPHIQEKAHFIGHLAGWDFSASPYLRGVRGDPLQIRSIALHFLTLFFHAVAGVDPVALFLEDLHWADGNSLDAFRHLLCNLPPRTPFLLIANTRPTLFERDPAWQTLAQTRIDLQPLSAVDSAILVADILRHVSELPAMLQELIVRQADGNPFYIEELIKMLIEEGVIQTGEAEWRVATERLASLRVPPTLTGVLLARLDSLPAAERLALQRAAVIGRIFWDAALQALNEEAISLADCQAWLASAQRRELIFQHPESAFAGTWEYIFKHALLHDVAYESLLKRERADYHARAARWLEAISGVRRGEYLSQIAEHYEKAGDSPQADHYFAQAGDQAMRVSAFADAANFYTRVQSATSSRHLKLAEAHYRLSDFLSARAAIQTAQSTAVNASDRAAALALLGEMTSELGDYAAAQEILAEAIPLARASNDQLTLCRTLYALGDVNWRQDKLDEARTALEESLKLARALDEVTHELFALNRLGAVTLMEGKNDEAERCFAKVYERARAVGNRERAMAALNNLAAVADRRADFALGQEYGRQALALAREVGAQQDIALYLINLAFGDIELGHLDAARAGLREGLELALRLGALPWAVAAVKNFGFLAYAEGNIEHALLLLGLACNHPAWSSDDQYQLDERLRNWSLDPAAVETTLAKGAELDWDRTIQELL